MTLEGFRDDMTGGWTFGYVEALKSAGMSPFLVLVSARVRRPVRWIHRDTGAPMWVLPAARAFRATRGRRLRLAPLLATPPVRLAGALRAERCRAVICQEYEYPRFDACVLTGRVLGIPCFGTFQGGDRPNALEKPLRPLTIRLSSGLIVGSSRERGRVRSTYHPPPGKVAAIPNPLDLAEWGPSDRGAAREELAVADGRTVVVWHGRIDIPQKGLDVLVEAWRRVSSRRPGRDVLLLIGSGRDTADMARLVGTLPAGSVDWRDEFVLDRGRMRRFLAAGDVYVFPSRHEGFPVAPVEAIACGLPVVAADAPGVADIFPEGERSGGLIVPCEDPDALAEALVGLLEHPDRRAAMREHALRRAQEGFSLESVGARLRDFLVARGVTPPG
ncbi:glycosyltransferase family 4 protein [Miltoncostaea oceani]|uniref:glycosyltransferase family 4 protein n=1 Tax=Miltoncostaea oceani TaxID=2843216 RepID=UPI001C3E69AF|nr:glycosyltransferase family 4 protein [Miltoncostaea oceani]